MAVEDLDDPDTGEAEVVAGVAVEAVGMAVKGEEEHEGAVDALRVEDLEQLAALVKRG